MISDVAHERKMVARPPFKFCQSRFKIGRLSGFMIFGADNQNIAFVVARKSYVMIRNRPEYLLFFLRRLGRVPQKHVLYLARHPQSQHITSIRRLLGMDDETVIDRTIGCDNSGSGLNEVAL